MTLSRIYQPSTRIEHYELDGLLNVLDRTINEHGENGETDTPYYVGAKIALEMIRKNDRLETQEDFMLVFENQLSQL